MSANPGNVSKSNPVERIVIVGGGSAGWMAAASICNATQSGCEVVLVESEKIGTIGVGEATIPYIKRLNRELGIEEAVFLRETKGSFKLGIEFINWKNDNHRYFHPFGRHGAEFDRVQMHHFWIKAQQEGLVKPFDEYSMCWGAAQLNRFEHPMPDPRNIRSTFDYAYHFDAGLYAQYLSKFALSKGCVRYEGIVVNVNQDSQSGLIKSIQLDSGQDIHGDFFIDCTGFRGVLIEQTLKTGYENWNHWLPANRAVAMACQHSEENFTPYTKSTARSAGWQWRIPLQHRVGNGFVYCSEYIEDELAAEKLIQSLEGNALTEPNFLRFETGRRRKFWNKNCLSLGLSAGFMEPLESTSLHLIHIGIARFLALFPSKGENWLSAEEYNRLTTLEYEWIRDFLILHYFANERKSGELWEYTRSMNIPESLKYKMDQFRSNGVLVSSGLELFSNPSWLAVYFGQGIMPQRYDPLVDIRKVDGVKYLKSIKGSIDEAAKVMPTHLQYLNKFVGVKPLN